MKAKCLIGAAAAALVAACGNSSDGRVAMEVAVSGLTEAQNFCFTWKVFQLDEKAQEWVLVDAEDKPVCGAQGVDVKSSLGTCFGGQRFLVAYDVTFHEGETQLGSAQGTSGGGENDVCESNFDTASYALFQFGNEGNVGGVNPGIHIDQICTNDKIQEENGKLVTALWMQPDECGEDAQPDSYCTLGYGEGLETLRYGITADGKVRFVFGESALDARWEVFYLAFEPEVPAATLILQHNPWVLQHALESGAAHRGLIENAVLAYRYDDSFGFVYYDGRPESLLVLADQTGVCNGPISFGALRQAPVLPECSEAPVFVGGIPRSGATFELVFRCKNNLVFIGCDALAAGDICVP